MTLHNLHPAEKKVCMVKKDSVLPIKVLELKGNQRYVCKNHLGFKTSVGGKDATRGSLQLTTTVNVASTNFRHGSPVNTGSRFKEANGTNNKTLIFSYGQQSKQGYPQRNLG